MKTTKEELEETRKKLKELEAQYEQETMDQKIQRQLPLRPVAKKIHDTFCPYDHNEYCSWGYEEDMNNNDLMWSKDTHKRYIDKVEQFLGEKIVRLESLEKFIDELIKLKKEFPFWRSIIKYFMGV